MLLRSLQLGMEEKWFQWYGQLIIHACVFLFLGFDPKTAKQLPNVETNMHIYACFSLPILFCLGFALNLVIWHKNRISYKFIFELDPRHNLDYHQFGEVHFALSVWGSLYWSFFSCSCHLFYCWFNLSWCILIFLKSLHQLYPRSCVRLSYSSSLLPSCYVLSTFSIAQHENGLQ